MPSTSEPSQLGPFATTLPTLSPLWIIIVVLIHCTWCQCSPQIPFIPHCIPTILLGISTVISNLPCSLMVRSHSLQICPALSGPHLAKVRDSKVPAPFSPPSDPVNTECKWFIAKPKRIFPTAPFPPSPHPFSASCCNSLLSGLFPVSPLSPTAFVDNTADLI